MKRKDRDNFDFIKNKFDGECAVFLSPVTEDNAKNLIDNAECKKVKPSKSLMLKRCAAAAACFAVIITALAVGVPSIGKSPIVPQENTNSINKSENSNGAQCFSNYEELKSAVKKIEKNNSKYVYYKNADSVFNAAKGDMAIEETAKDVAFAKTNTQVASVDEGDIIKTDGRYIYYTNGNSLIIYTANGKKSRAVSELNFYTEDGSVNNYGQVYDLFVYKNRLIVNTVYYKMISDGDIPITRTIVYDVFDGAKPKEIFDFEQSGYYVSSRMLGDRLYLVSNHNVNSHRCKKDSDYAPFVRCKDAVEPLKPEKISYAENVQEPSYIVVSALDVITGKKSGDSAAVLGAGDDIYMNENNLYIACGLYGGSASDYIKNGRGTVTENTQLIKMTFTDAEIKFVSSVKVKGYIDNQFSIDENNGFVRIATTSKNKNGDDTNNLFVYDKNLKKVGAVTGFANDESIKAVRFIGDTAYVITYKQTDPLFVIDLTEPKNPQIKGSVKISGFSSVLLPAEDNKILGIGYSTYQNNENEAVDGLKLALFDVSDSAHPTVLDSYVMKNTDSEAQYNHKAVVIAPDYFAIPFFTYPDGIDKGGALIIKIKNNKLAVSDKCSVAEDGYYANCASRCTYVGNNLYLIDHIGSIHSFEMK